MSREALACMATTLQALQQYRALINQEVLGQLKEIGDRQSPGVSEHAWNDWKHGRTTPRARHRRLLADWIGPPATPQALYQGLIRINRRGDVTLAEESEEDRS